MKVQDLFPGSVLRLPSNVVENISAPAAAWIDHPLNRILLGVSILTFVISLGLFLGILPNLAEAFASKRGGARIQNNLSIARVRDILFSLNILPLSLLIDSLGLYEPGFKSAANPSWSVLISFGAICTYFMLRSFFYAIGRSEFRSKESYLAAKRSLNTSLVLIIPLCVLTVLVMDAFNANLQAVRIVILSETGFAWFAAVITSAEILFSNRGVFSTFLYLCGFEFLPVFMLVYSSLRF